MFSKRITYFFLFKSKTHLDFITSTEIPLGYDLGNTLVTISQFFFFYKFELLYQLNLDQYMGCLRLF